MSGFWKFTVFVGTLGFVLFGVGGYGALLKPEFFASKQVVDAMFHVNLDQTANETLVPAYLLGAGLVCQSFMVLMTTVGLLVNFFLGAEPSKGQ